MNEEEGTPSLLLTGFDGRRTLKVLWPHAIACDTRQELPEESWVTGVCCIKFQGLPWILGVCPRWTHEMIQVDVGSSKI